MKDDVQAIKTRFAALCFAAALVAGAASAQPPPPVASTAAPTRPSPHAYRIDGKVVDARSGAPLPRCAMQIADVKERGDTRTIAAGDDGSFSFDGLAPGKYSLTAQRRGYLAQAYEQHGEYSTAIAVGPGRDSEGIVFRLPAEGIISGTVLDEAGEPVRGAQVRLFQDENAQGIRATQQRETVTTDDRGVYELRGLRPGAYFLVVTAHPWYAERLRSQLPADDAPDQGSSARSQSAALDVAYPATFYPGVTDQDAAAPIPVKPGDRLQADITLAAQPAMRLRLNVPPGDGGRLVSVMLSQTIFGQVEQQATRVAFTPDGVAEVDGILPGHYEATIIQSSTGQGRSQTTRFETDVASGATEISAESAAGEVAVAGKVVPAAGKLPGFAGISLRLAGGGRQQQYGALDEAGNFTLDVAPGTYEVLGNINGMHIVSMKASGAALAGRMLTVKSGDTPKLEILVGTGHGEIEGVAMRGGKPASGVMVLLAPEDAKNNQILFRRDQSDSDGTFDLANIFPGRYRLLAIQEGWELEWANPAVLEAFLAKSVPVEVKAGDHLNQTVEAQGR
jgi:hypothetical protein